MSNGVLVLTVNTRPSPNLEIWKKSAKRYGYIYEILGLGEVWEGWTWRTKKYIEAIKKYKNFDIFILCDSDDLYFTGPCSEFLEKFNKIGAKVVVGSEDNCCTVPLSDNEKKEIIDKLYDIRDSKNITSKYYAPNGGCMFGYQHALLELLYKLSEHEDDQHGCILEYIKNNNIVTLDYYQTIVGNYVQLMFSDIIYDWEIGNNHRPHNILTDTYPVIMHFPGINYSNYQLFMHSDDKNIDLNFKVKLRAFYRENHSYIFVILVFFIVIFIFKFIKKNN